ncbi:MAG: hypothetical protein LBF64_06185 [Oscillospiraceae bacterium]|jgi:hypothetical protein|nr:hypothetical protein [Oscillospiraceae bacterium]
MIGDIFDAISARLHGVFGSEYEIYADRDIGQGLTEPCFFIALIQSEQIRKIGGRYYCPSAFDVHYFPRADRDNKELHDVSATLFSALEFVETPGGDLIRGTSMRAEVADGVLHFFVSYNMYLLRLEERGLDAMDHLRMEGGVTT